MATKKVSHKGKQQYGIYQTQLRYSKNKRRKLERHVKKYPEDLQAQKVLTAGITFGFSYKRKTPVTPEWTRSEKALSKLMYDIDGMTAKKYLEMKKENLRVHRKDTE